VEEGEGMRWWSWELGDGGGMEQREDAAAAKRWWSYTDVAIWEGDLRVNTRKGDAVKWKVNGEGRLRGQNPVFLSPFRFRVKTLSFLCSLAVIDYQLLFHGG
jgi:hypothetical protein